MNNLISCPEAFRLVPATGSYSTSSYLSMLLSLGIGWVILKILLIFLITIIIFYTTLIPIPLFNFLTKSRIAIPLPSINALMSRVVGSIYFCKIFFDFGVNAFITNFFPTSTAALFPASKAFFAPSLATFLPTPRGEDAICLAALLVKILVKKFAMVSNITELPYANLFLNP